jgi:hypothetical protein
MQNFLFVLAVAIEQNFCLWFYFLSHAMISSLYRYLRESWHIHTNI